MVVRILGVELVDEIEVDFLLLLLVKVFVGDGEVYS